MADPDVVLSARVVQPSDAAVADLELALQGIPLPVSELGGPVGTPPAAGRVRVAVTQDAAAAAAAAGGLVLADREGTPLALLEDIDVRSARSDPGGDDDAGARAVEGRLVALRAPEVGAYRGLRQAPTDVPAHGPRRVVVALRPPLQSDAGALNPPADGDALVLVPVAGTTTDGLPPDVLVPAVGAATTDRPGLRVIAVPLATRDADSDRALARALASAYGSTETVLLDPGEPRWRDALGALREGTEEPADVDPAVLAELLRWRPPRRERGLVVLFTGLSGSGKSTLARDLVEHLRERTRRTVSLLDGDDVRRLLSSGLGFDRAARDLNVRRIGYVATEVARHGGTAVCAPIAPYAASRAAVRFMVESVGDLVLVHVSTPLAECERRDLKGLYAKARAGLLPEFTGVSDPYETPLDADVAVDTSRVTEAEALSVVLEHLYGGGWVADRSEG